MPNDEHDLKTWPAYFEAIWKGEKSFELRRFDRDYKVGDKLYLWEFDPIKEKLTDRMVQARITYVLSGGLESLGLRDRFCILSIQANERLHCASTYRKPPTAPEEK